MHIYYYHYSVIVHCKNTWGVSNQTECGLPQLQEYLDRDSDSYYDYRKLSHYSGQGIINSNMVPLPWTTSLTTLMHACMHDEVMTNL